MSKADWVFSNEGGKEKKLSPEAWERKYGFMTTPLEDVPLIIREVTWPDDTKIYKDADGQRYKIKNEKVMVRVTKVNRKTPTYWLPEVFLKHFEEG